MRAYRNMSGSSGVEAYDFGEDWIAVRFKDGSYLYTYDSAGAENVEQMKSLAEAGRGLSTFINQHVKDQYARRLS